ncbi:MAG: acyl-CoA thioesterase [Clostridia bacterium]|nr:acyl-CoA thioesterase [Clostridia bacterium]
MFAYERTAQYHETDQMGVIHHSNYVKWMEEARVAFLDSVGLSYRSMEEDGVLSPVIGISLEYKRPVRFGDVVSITVTPANYTGVRYELRYTMTNRSTGEVCTTAVSRHCFLKNGRIVSLKKVLPETDRILMQDAMKD